MINDSRAETWWERTYFNAFQNIQFEREGENGVDGVSEVDYR